MTREPKLSIPWEGVRELFHSWSGKGQLFAGLAVALSNNDFEWKAADVERRAHRVLFESCRHLLAGLPSRTRDWLAIVPVHARVSKVSGQAPRGRVDWVATRRTGWPPREFSGRVRSRTSDENLLGVLRWTVDRLLVVYVDAMKVKENIGADVEKQLAVLTELAARPELQQVEPTLPDDAMLKDVHRAGARWRSVAELARLLRREDTDDLVEIARRQIEPDPELGESLFHLGVFGLVLAVLREETCRTVSLRPLHGKAKGAAYRVEDPHQRTWDLWFEAADVWKDYGHVEPYVLATSGVIRPGRNKRADIFLIDRTRRLALIVECKYSDEASYIRDGYEQALTYLTEARTAMIDAGAAFVVAPSEKISRPSVGNTFAGSVTFCAPEHFKDAFRTALRQLQSNQVVVSTTS